MAQDPRYLRRVWCTQLEKLSTNCGHNEHRSTSWSNGDSDNSVEKLAVKTFIVENSESLIIDDGNIFEL